MAALPTCPCPLCGHKSLIRRRIGYISRHESGKVVRIPPASHLHCAKCGNSFYDRDTVRRISKTWARRPAKPKVRNGRKARVAR